MSARSQHHQPVGASSRPGLFTNPQAAAPLPSTPGGPPGGGGATPLASHRSTTSTASARSSHQAAAATAFSSSSARGGPSSAPPPGPSGLANKKGVPPLLSVPPSSPPAMVAPAASPGPRPASSANNFSSSPDNHSHRHHQQQHSAPPAAGGGGVPSMGYDSHLQQQQQQHEGEGEGGRLELEHVIGFSGRFQGTYTAHPTHKNKTLASVSAMVVVSDLEDPHDQTLLRAHDMEVSALAVSKNGELVASGQVGTEHRKGYGAPVVVWDYHHKSELFLLPGITVKVTRLSFSPDDRLLLGCGEDGQLFIWDMGTGEVVYRRRFPSALTLAQWTSVFLKGRRPAYELAYAHDKQVEVCEFCFDASRVQWALTPQPIAMPCTGLVRRYLCSGVSSDGDHLLAGTDVGEMVVLRVTSKVYRASIPVGSGGIWSLLVLPGWVTGLAPGAGLDVVLCGCGDGTIRKIRGGDMRWEVLDQGRLPCGARVVALSLTADGHEAIAATAHGSSYRVLLSELSSVRPVAQAHTQPVTALAFPKTRPDVVATGAQDGVVKVWDLSTYDVIASAREPPAAGAVTALVWVEEGVVLSGWSDGFLRAYGAASGAKAWVVPNAHRRAVSCLACHRDPSSFYIVSGGQDGSVRVWHGLTRELMMQFTEHHKAVTALVVDVSCGHRVHSSGEDCMVLSYDLRTERRYNIHTVRDGSFLGLSQRVDGEAELVTCDSHGRLLFWDCDYPDPTLAVYDDSPQARLTAVAVSPATGHFLLTASSDSCVKALDLRGLVTGHSGPIGLGRGHSGAVKTVAWSPDEKQAVSIGEDGCICVWNFYAN